MRNLTSGANSVIFEKYNVRAGFEAKKLFRKSVRLVAILMRAGGCFRKTESLKVRKIAFSGFILKVLDDSDMRFYDSNNALGKMAHVFNPTLFRADKSLKVPKNIARDLRTHPGRDFEIVRFFKNIYKIKNFGNFFENFEELI